MLAYRLFIRSLAGAAALTGASLGAMAQEPQPQQLEGIVVEAAGLEPVEAGKVGSAYTVVTGAEMERRQIRHAADALRGIPGVSVSQSSGPGSLNQVRIRGGEASHVVVLVDGVDVDTLDRGDFDFSTLLAADIEKIEVIRGPQSGVYGGNALSGVINIVTRKGTGTPRAMATVEGGSFGTRAVTANASAGAAKGYFSATAASRSTDGFNIADGLGELDGSEQKAFFTRGGVTLSDKLRIDGMLRYQSNRADIDDDWGNGALDLAGFTNEREQAMGSIAATLDLTERWSQKIFANRLQDDFESHYPGFAPYSTAGERNHWGYQSSYRFDTPDMLAARHVVTGLIEQKQESFETSATAGTFERNQTGFVSEYRGEFLDRLFLSGNLRRDLNDAFANVTTWRTTAAYAFRETGTRLHGSYGKGIQNPGFAEQFGIFTSPAFVGNPSVLPEESLGWDIGVEQKLWADRLILDVTYFDADLTNKIVNQEIDTDGDGTLDSWTVVNLGGKSKRRGVELALTAALAPGLTLSGAYTYTDAEDADGLQEVRRPNHAASLNTSWSLLDGRAQIDLGIIYNGAVRDELFGLGSVRLDDYSLVNLAASYKLSEQVTLFGRVQNLTDADYEEIFDYNTAPIAAYAGMKVSFEAGAPLDAGPK
jgi:vitamin B12 transporter